MSDEDPDDIPTKALGRANKTRISLSDDDAPTARLASPNPRPPVKEAILSPSPVNVDRDSVVTRRISGPRRLDTYAELEPPRRLPGFDTPPKNEELELPVGWLVIVSGPGRGHHFSIYNGMNSLGREPGNTVAVEFGDDKISRHDHCYVTFDDEDGAFWVQHGGKSNLVRLNDKPVLEPVKLQNGDYIRVGATRFRFVALCDENFNWTMCD
ncbi:FHA domain-containing protein [Sinorhizobium fredii]|uniref:FHA domain-containing protein n=1 Tax=Rhizobium fredii TaxID=380 RepID=UPI003518EBF1